MHVGVGVSVCVCVFVSVCVPAFRDDDFKLLYIVADFSPYCLLRAVDRSKFQRFTPATQYLECI